jgi:hypothetical protein
MRGNQVVWKVVLNKLEMLLYLSSRSFDPKHLEEHWNISGGRGLNGEV